MASSTKTLLLLCALAACMHAGLAARQLFGTSDDTCSCVSQHIDGNDDPSVCDQFKGTTYCKYDSSILPGSVTCTGKTMSFTLYLTGTPEQIYWSVPSNVHVVATLAKGGDGYCLSQDAMLGTPIAPLNPAQIKAGLKVGTNRGLSHFAMCWMPCA